MDHAASWESDRGGYSFVPHKDGGAIDGRDVIDAVTVEVAKADNLKKLRDMQTAEKHLWVWVDYTKPAAWSALCSGYSKLPVPNLPEEVTTLWIAATTSTSTERFVPAAVHSITPPDDWSTHD
ncbi:MAG: hypothetical protein ABMA25_05825 [Ilumatobacteraceae bacterium]